MKNVTFLILGLFLFLGFSLKAARVDTIQVRSNAMNKNVSVVVVVPEKALQGEHCPAVYLLHGFGGNHRSWIELKPELPVIADREGFFFVCPDGQQSWYWDSPKNPLSRYETFISSELIACIDSLYVTIPERKGRAITGLSMGGHGALWNAIRHQEVFGAAGSTSGGVDIRPFPNKWEMKKQLGTMDENREIWEAHTVINLIDQLKSGALALIFDCGYDDFFFEVNNRLHTKLNERKIEHDYLTRPGVHSQVYWRNSIDYQILFFRKFFDRK